MNKYLVWILILGCVSVLGCGNAVDITVYDLSNTGEIKGKVYDSAASNFYTSNYVPIAGAKVYVGDQTATTDADGSYQLSGITAGAVTVTATAAGYISQTLLVNRNSVNIYLMGGTVISESGATTLTGTIYGLPTGVTSVYGNAYSLAQSSSNFNYDSSVYKYTLTKSPDEGETYIFAYYSSSEAGFYRNIYTYARVDMGSAAAETNLDFSTSTGSLAVNAVLPTGYTYPVLNIGIYDNYRLINVIYSKSHTQEGAFVTSSLPRLQPGDSFGVAISASGTVAGEEGYKVLYKYNVSSEAALDLDLTEVPKVVIENPADGASLTSNPAFEWEVLNDEQVIYSVSLVAEGSSEAVWTGLTKENSLILPDTILLGNGNYRWKVVAAHYVNLDVADIGLTIPQSHIDWISASDARIFSYAR